MLRHPLILAAIVVAGFAMPSRAAAQNSPTVSPYLNLLNSDQFGNPGGIAGTYQNLVKPFIEQREAATANRNSINRLRAQIQSPGIPRSGGTTGGSYLTRFQNYSHYYSDLPVRPNR
jgi:hypothetical protein